MTTNNERVMKLVVEIKDNEFCYSYEIGKSRSAGTMPLNESGLFLFSDLLAHLTKTSRTMNAERHKAFDSYVFAKANPDLIKEVQEQIKKDMPNMEAQ